MDPATELASSLSGEHIAKMLRTDGPTVSCVLLRSRGDTKTNSNTDDDQKKPSSDHKNVIAAEDSEDDNDEKIDSPRTVLTDLISEIQIDTTPKKQMVSQTLGGPFTFLGQYEDEGIMIMIRRPEDIEETGADVVLNPHSLQPPLHNAEVYGDILLMRIAPIDDEGEQVDNKDNEADAEDSKASKFKEDESEPAVDKDPSASASAAGTILPNEEFFLDYTKEEYIKFASRTDIIPVDPILEDGENEVEEAVDSDEDNEDPDGDGDDDDEDDDYNVESDDEEDMEDDECQIGMMNLILAQILKRFREENGRGPNTEELLTMRSALAEKLGIDESLVNETSGSAEQQLSQDKKRTNEDDSSPPRNQKRVKFRNKNQVKIMTDDEASVEDSAK